MDVVVNNAGNVIYGAMPEVDIDIFDAILGSATRLCRADAGTLRLSEESGLRLVAVRGDPLAPAASGNIARCRASLCMPTVSLP